MQTVTPKIYTHPKVTPSSNAFQEKNDIENRFLYLMQTSKTGQLEAGKSEEVTEPAIDFTSRREFTWFSGCAVGNREVSQHTDRHSKQGFIPLHNKGNEVNKFIYQFSSLPHCITRGNVTLSVTL